MRRTRRTRVESASAQESRRGNAGAVMRRGRPSVTLRCIADTFVSDRSERIVEFDAGDGKGTGGLISLLRRDDGTLLLSVYRCSGPIQLSASHDDGGAVIPITRLNRKRRPAAPRDRATRPRYGDQTACRFCDADIEYHGRPAGWIDRGGDSCCPEGGTRRDGDGAMVPFPADQRHEPTSDRVTP
jgi:hypothetical protein